MTAWASWTAKTIMLTAGFAAAGGGLSTAAFAGTGGGGAVTSGMGSVGGGNQVSAPITIPANVCGNAVALLGIAGAGCRGGAVVRSHEGGTWMVTNGSGSVLGGNQVNVPVTAPVDACGNSVAVLGIAGAGCEGGASTQKPGWDAVTSLLPVIWRPQAGLTAYDMPAAGHPVMMPASTLSAAENGGMSSTSFFTLAGGVLLAGISALKMSGLGSGRTRRGAA